MTVRIYGIRNCDTMKKTFAWLEANKVDFVFHDYKKSGTDPETLTRWCTRLGWKTLVNTRGTTWRKLDPARQLIGSDADAIALMCEHTSVIRRPVIETPEGDVLVGFDEHRLAERLCERGAA